MPYGFRNHTCNLYHFAHAASLGSRTEKVKIAPMAAQIHKTCKAVGIPHISAAQPTNGVRRPPMVILKPKVTPEAKPTFLPKKVCPSTTIALYGANKVSPTGTIKSAASQAVVL